MLVSFAIDRQGRLRESAVLESSGVAGLDKAALDMLKRADPMPPLPEGFEQEIYRVSVPVRFSVR